MNKKLLSVLVLLSTCLGVSSCQSGDNNDENNDNSTSVDPVFTKFEGELERNVEIKVLENDTAIKQGYLDELINAFNEEYAEYGIKAVDANMGEFTDLAQAGPYGYGPDVLYQANDVIMKYVDQKHVTPLPTDKLEAYDQIPEEAWSAYEAEVGEKEYTFGVPINIQTGLLYYRKDLLPEDWTKTWDDNKNNVPDMVENLADLYQFSKMRHEANPDQYGFEYSINDFYISSGFLFSFGGYVFGDNNRDDTDIGLSANDARYGAQLIWQLASTMSVSCQDDSAKLAISGNMASGKYFASVTTPDVRSVIVDALALEYQKAVTSLDDKDAYKLADENIVGVTFPRLPKNGDLNNPSEETIPMISMGGINGYAMSSYTKYPKASLAFINFATNYEMVKKREEILQIAPCREDVSLESGTLSQELFNKVSNGEIELMPSISSVGQIWYPTQSFLADLAADPKREVSKQLYNTLDKLQAGLEEVSQSIYDAIHLLG